MNTMTHAFEPVNPDSTVCGICGTGPRSKEHKRRRAGATHNGQHEPPYASPEQTVMVSLADIGEDGWVCHLTHRECSTEAPHRMSECGRFQARCECKHDLPNPFNPDCPVHAPQEKDSPPMSERYTPEQMREMADYPYDMTAGQQLYVRKMLRYAADQLATQSAPLTSTDDSMKNACRHCGRYHDGPCESAPPTPELLRNLRDVVRRMADCGHEGGARKAGTCCQQIADAHVVEDAYQELALQAQAGGDPPPPTTGSKAWCYAHGAWCWTHPVERKNILCRFDIPAPPQKGKNTR
jgi:hypothetical protein